MLVRIGVSASRINISTPVEYISWKTLCHFHRVLYYLLQELAKFLGLHLPYTLVISLLGLLQSNQLLHNIFI